VNIIQILRKFKSGAIRDGRSIIVLALIVYFSILSVLHLQSGSMHAWQRLGIYHLRPVFADMRFLLCAIETERAGHDSYRMTECDPWHRVMNYPRLWLSLSVFGLGARHTVPMSIALALVFYVSLLVLVGRLTLREGAFYAFLVCSPAVMLGIERGNVDLLIFSLLTLAILLFQSFGTRSVWPYGLVMLCSFLKFYPIFAMAVALRDRSRAVALSIIGVAATAFLTYLYWIRHDLALIVKNTWQQAFNISFGSKVIFFLHNADPHIGPINVTAWSRASVVAVLAIALAIVIFKRRPAPLFTAQNADSMLVGLSIYVGTFAFLGTNYNYKFIFLIFAVPQMLEWIRRRDPYRDFAFTFLTIMALAFWLSAQEVYWLFIFKELTNWCLFGMSIVVLLHFALASLGGKRSPGDPIEA
jgi:hypothetical protein